MTRLEKDEALARLAEEADLAAPFGGCVMCRLASRTNAHAYIAESEHGIVVLDGYGATRGHLLVVAREHVERAAELSWPVYSDLQQLVWRATRVLEAELAPERVYTASLGASRSLPMSFPHFHSHVVPVYEHGEAARPARVFSWSSGVVCYEGDEARRLSARLRGAWGRAERGAERSVGRERGAERSVGARARG
jgi:diadenosine tetraphosphate (Ap4A) HIT family hydrolase